VLFCYLDDSGKDPQNRITTLAGYIAKEDQWRDFEVAVEPIFDELGVSVSHAKDLHNTDGEFAGWSVLKKQSFIARICRVLSRYAVLGVSMSVLKETYEARAAESGRVRTVTPYAFCFSVIMEWLLTDVRVGRLVHTDGVSFILELGHENNPEAEEQFHWIRKHHKLENVLRSICFVGKEGSRAIQMADLLAFYSRRHGAAMERAPIQERANVSPVTMINIITEATAHRGFVAIDFGPDSVGARFLADLT